MQEFWKDIDSIKELIKLAADSKIDFTWQKDDGCKIVIKAGERRPSMPPMQSVPMPVNSPQGSVQSVEVIPVTSQNIAVPQNVSQTQAADVNEQTAAEDENLKIVTSPLVGTFYSAASPEDEPFVKVGDKVSKGQKLGIIEAMKLMNDIESDFDGEIVEIMVSNESVVEYGQPLFKIR